MRRDALWTSVATLLSVSAQLGIMLWLSQSGNLNLIGQLAILAIVLGFAGYLQDLGIANFIISEPDLSKSQKSQLFYLTLTLAAASACILTMAAPFIAKFYQEQSLVLYLQMIAIQIFIQGFGNQPQAILIRHHKLQNLAAIDIISRVVMLMSFVALQQYSSGIMAFVVANLIFTLLRTALLLQHCWHEIFLHPGPVECAFLRRAIRYGLFQSGSQIIGYFRHRLDQLILGKMMGLENLGQYSMAREITQQPFKVLNPVISRLFLPRFTSHSTQQLRLERALQLSLRSHLIAFSALALFCVSSLKYILPTQFSDVSLLVIALLPYAVLKAPGMVFAVQAQSTANVHREFYWNLWSSLVTIPLLIVIAAQDSLLTVALILSLWQTLMTFAALRYFVDSQEHRARCNPLIIRFTAGSWSCCLLLIFLLTMAPV